MEKPAPRVLLLERTAAVVAPSTVLAINDGKAALEALANPQLGADAIVVDALFRAPGAISAIQRARAHRPATPVFLLSGPQSGLSQHDINRLGVKAISADRFLPWLGGFLASSEEATLREAVEDRSFDPRYIPVPIADFLPGQPCPFDVYARLPSGRHVALSRAGEALGRTRARKYVEHGVKALYVSRRALERYTAFCDSVEEGLLSNSSAGPDIRLVAALNRSEEFATDLKLRGASESLVARGLDRVIELNLFLSEWNALGRSWADALRTEAALYDHSVQVTLMCLMLAQIMGMSSMDSVRCIGIAALLHDVGFLQLPARIREGSPIHPTDQALYERHPLLGAEVLASIPGVESRVVQAVARHHERRDGSGFPKRVGSGEQINRMAEMIGIADEIMIDRAKDPEAISRSRVNAWTRANSNRFTLDALNALKLLFAGQ